MLASACWLATHVCGACTVSVQVEAEGKPCPCPADYACESGSCRRTAATCSPSVRAEDFKPTWSTPESIRWDWVPVGAEASFSTYELVIAGSEDDAQSASGSAVVFDASVNPELGFYILPHETDLFEVTYTITDALTPFNPSQANRYYAMLKTRDVNGCTHETPIVEGTTKLAPVSRVTIFDDTLMSELWGAPLLVASGCGVDGSECLRCSAGTCLGQSGPWNLLRLVGAIDLSAVTPNALNTGQAYLELSISVVSETPVFYSEIGVGKDSAPLVVDVWDFVRAHLRATTVRTYQKIQVPLVALMFNGAPLSPEVLATPLTGFRIGAAFLGASDVYLDAVSVNW